MCALSGECVTLSGNPATQQGPTLAQLRKFSFVPEPTPIERPAPGLAGRADTPKCAPGGCYYPSAKTPVVAPAISTDGPRTAPDALIKHAPVAEPGTNWRTIGGIIAGGLAGLLLVASALVARRRRTTMAGL
jgi:hypothetical protein